VTRFRDNLDISRADVRWRVRHGSRDAKLRTAQAGAYSRRAEVATVTS